MIDNRNVLDVKSINKLSSAIKNFLNETRSKLKGSERRKFMANVVRLLGKGGQRLAERELGWDRETIIRGTKELASGFGCVDHYSGRGRHRIEQQLPNLLDDIKEIVDPVSQCDPTFRTAQLYSPITAKEVLRRLIEDKHYSLDQVPTMRTISNKLNSNPNSLFTFRDL